MSTEEKQDYSAAVEASVDHQSDVQITTLSEVTPKLVKPWFTYRHIALLNFLLLGSLLAQVVCGYDGSMMNGLQAVPTWNEFFNNPSGAVLGTMSNGTSIGALVMMPFVSYIIDYLGRRWSVILGCVIICIGAALQGGANSFGMFVGGRVLLGLGGAISLTAAPPLVTECAYPTQRPVVTALLMPSWPLGALVAALVTWGTYNGPLVVSNWSWRIPSLLQLALPLVQIFIAFFGPESPRWLIDKGRHQEAEEFFTKYHAAGDKNHPIVAYEMAEISATIEEEKAQSVGSWVQWFKGKTMIHRLFLCIAVPLMQQLSGNALISFYLPIILKNAGITNADDQLRINLGLSAWTLVCSIVGAYIVGVFRRRTLFLTGYASMFVVYIVFTIVSAINAPYVVPGSPPNKPLSSSIVFLIFLYNMVYQICSPIAFTYVMEICPYSMRSKGSMLYQFAGAIVGFFNNYANPIAMEVITWKYYIVYCVWLVVQFGIVWFLFPETYGRDLEEVNQAFNDNLVSGREAMEKAHLTINVNVEKGGVLATEKGSEAV
ncbi:hypothetical protein VKS41_008362 [Umbelopsis sp. WA50703]